MGAEDCIYHIVYVDKCDGILVQTEQPTDDEYQEILKNFHGACSRIKHLFEQYRHKKVTWITRKHS